MKKLLKRLVFVCAIILCSGVYATPNAWLSTSYYDSWYRSPVTDGHLDILLLVDNVSFTNLEFSVTYDSSIVYQIGAGSVNSVMSGLSVESVTTEFLEGTWMRSTVAISGDVTIGEAQYESDAILQVRFTPHAEGTMPVGLWEGGWTRYPASYTNCSLSLEENGEPVYFERKMWNDEIVLFTFTDKTAATILYEFDYNFGTPITNGFLRVVYEDATVEDIAVSDPTRGLTIANPYGGYFITPLAGAVSYTLMFPEYWEVGPLELGGGFYTSHSQPSGYFGIAEITGHESIRTSPNDITLTIQQDGIGADFASHSYGAAMVGEGQGIMNKTFTITEIDANSVRLVIEGGLEEDYYNLYMYKDGLIVGMAWFSALNFYEVTFTVSDQLSYPLEGAKILLPQWGMHGRTMNEHVTDANGQATVEMAGNSEWGQYYEFYVTAAGYDNYEGYVEVYASDVEVSVMLEPAAGVDFGDFAEFGMWWNSADDCSWNSNCEGFDFDYSGVVDFEDMVVISERWLMGY